MTDDERRVYRKQLKATLAAYKDPSKVSPKLRESIEASIEDEYSKSLSKFTKAYEQQLEALDKREKEVLATMSVVQKAKQAGKKYNPKAIAPLPAKRKITL